MSEVFFEPSCSGISLPYMPSCLTMPAKRYSVIKKDWTDENEVTVLGKKENSVFNEPISSSNNTYISTSYI